MVNEIAARTKVDMHLSSLRRRDLRADRHLIDCIRCVCVCVFIVEKKAISRNSISHLLTYSQKTNGSLEVTTEPCEDVQNRFSLMLFLAYPQILLLTHTIANNADGFCVSLSSFVITTLI